MRAIRLGEQPVKDFSGLTPGYYWTRTEDEWVPGLWTGEQWYQLHACGLETDVDYIDEVGSKLCQS